MVFYQFNSTPKEAISSGGSVDARDRPPDAPSIIGELSRATVEPGNLIKISAWPLTLRRYSSRAWFGSSRGCADEGNNSGWRANSLLITRAPWKPVRNVVHVAETHADESAKIDSSREREQRVKSREEKRREDSHRLLVRARSQFAARH